MLHIINHNISKFFFSAKNYLKSKMPKALFIFLFLITHMVKSQTPLPEHPRPDFNRPMWINLNGSWDFKFDSDNRGLKEGWFKGTKFDKKIIVPFPWGSKLS